MVAVLIAVVFIATIASWLSWRQIQRDIRDAGGNDNDESD